MSVFKRRKRALVGVLALAAAAALIPASAASAATFPNACKNSVTANQSQIGVTMTADAPASVAPGGTVALTNIQQTANVPGGIFVAGYNLGLLVVGPNTIPTTVVTTIEGTNTVQGTQNTNAVSTSISTTISDPDGSPGTGDETGTDGSFSVTYNDQTWTAGPSGTINFREDTVPIGAGAGVLHTGGLRITAVIQGFLTVRFGCSPGTVAGPDPGVVTLDDPAVPFASTSIVVPNDPPTADAGPDQTVASGANVTLNGNGSSDPNAGDTLDYSWTQTGGGAVSLTGANTATPSFTAPTGPATLTFELTVTDDAGATDTDTVVVNVEAPPNQPPTADAGPDQTVASGASVTLNGNGSTDPDGTIASYAWTQTVGPNVSLTGANTATPSFTAPPGPATLEFRLTVTDNNGATASNTVVVNVNAPAGSVTFPNACKNSVTPNNSQISVTMLANAPASANPGDSVALTNIQQTVSVPGAIFVAGYNLGLLAPGPNTVPASIRTTIEGTNTVEGTQTTNTVATSISTSITDPDGSRGTGDESATPGALSVSYNNQTWTADADGGTIQFREDTIQPVSGGTGGVGAIVINSVISGALPVNFGCSPGTVTGPDPGVITFDDPAVSFASTDVAAPNVAPTADAGADQTVASGASVTLNGNGSTDTDGTIASYAWTQTGGGAVSLTGANTATPSFTAPTGPATLTFELTVTDNDGATDTDTVVVTVEPPPNELPVADAGTDQTVASNALVSLDGTGSTDPDGTVDSYAWTQTGGTAVTLSGANTATPSFTAPTGPATLTFQLTVTDNDGATDTDTVVVNVLPPPPVVDAGGTVIVNGPTSIRKTSKAFVVEVRNTGTAPLTVLSTNIDADVTVNGSPSGVVIVDPATKTLSPGAKFRFKATWNYTGLVAGDSVEYTACVNVTGDINAGNDCDTATATAK